MTMLMFGRDAGTRPTHRPIKVGVLGYGYWGSKHVRVLAGLPGVELTVVECDIDRLQAAVSAYPNVQAAARLSDVESCLDALIIATPPHSHGPVAMRALRAGLHVLVEKPLATSVESAESLVETANAQGLTLMTGHTFEYSAAVWKLREIIDSGELGRILYVDTARLNLGRYQADCNVIWDLAPHDISIVSYLLGEFPATVSAWTQRNVGAVHADVAYLRLDFESTGASAFVHVSWLDPRKVRRVTVVGERKMAVYNDLSDERIKIYDVSAGICEGGGSPDSSIPVSYHTGDTVSPYVHLTEPLMVQDVHFIDCVRTGRRPDTPGERGLDVVKVLAATDEARATGGCARIQPTRLNSGEAVVAGVDVAS